MGLISGIAGAASKNLAIGFQTRSQRDATRIAQATDAMQRALRGDGSGYQWILEQERGSATLVGRNAYKAARAAVEAAMVRDPVLRARLTGQQLPAGAEAPSVADQPPVGGKEAPSADRQSAGEQKATNTALMAGLVGALALGVALARPK